MNEAFLNQYVIPISLNVLPTYVHTHLDSDFSSHAVLSVDWLLC